MEVSYTASNKTSADHTIFEHEIWSRGGNYRIPVDRNRLMDKVVSDILQEKEMHETERAFFKVVGMYCTSCKPVIEKHMKNEKGVKRIHIDYKRDSVF